MAFTIPYDPSLVLASVVREKALQNVVAITEAQGPVEGVQDSLNSLIQSKRSLEMTKTELKYLGIATTSLETEIKKLAEEVGKAAAAYAAVKMTTEPKI